MINESKFTDEELKIFLKKLERNFGFDDMYYSQGPITCYATNKLIVVIMAEDNYSDLIGGGGTEMKRGIYLFNNDFEKIGELWLKEWRHRMNPDLDDWSRRLNDIISIKDKRNRVIVKCTTGGKKVNKNISVSKTNSFPTKIQVFWKNFLKTLGLN